MKRLVAAVLVVLPLLGCFPPHPKPHNSGTDGGTDAGIPLGRLDVWYAGPPDAVYDFKITGPDGYEHHANGHAMLDIPPGTYEVSAAPLVIKGPRTTQIFDGVVPESPVQVVAGQAVAVVANFSLRQGTGKLWVTDRKTSVVFALRQDQLEPSGTPISDTALGVPASSQPYSPVFDKDGNLWVALATTGKLVRYTPSQLATGTPTETASISSPHAPSHLVFDAAGNLYVSNSGNATLVKYAAADLKGSGVLTPTPLATFNSTRWTHVEEATFDAAGNLWVANGKFTGTPYGGEVLTFSKASLEQTGSVTLTPTAALTHAALAGIQTLRFDAAGNLWTGNFGDGTSTSASLARFEAGSLPSAGDSTTAPGRVIQGSALLSPVGIVFDNSASLWMADYTNRTLVRFDASQLVGSGTTTETPAAVLSSTTSGMGYTDLSFDPEL